MHWPPHPLETHASRVGAGDPQAAAMSPRRRRYALVTLSLAMAMSGLDMTTINVALPSLAQDLHASTNDLQWIVDAYAIVLAGLLLLGNGLADRFGRRRAFVSGMVLFTLGTLSAAYSGSTTVLIASRGVMGAGAALVLGPALALIAVIFPPEERGHALAIWTLFGALGVSFGPVLAGVLLHTFWWGSVFLVTVPVCVAAAIGGIAFLPESRRPDAPPLDVVGATLSVIGLGSLLFGIIQGPNLGWTTPVIWGPILFGSATLTAFIVWELRTPEPMFNPRILRIGAVVAGTMTVWSIYVAFIGTQFIVPQWLQFVGEHSTLAVGLMMLPMSMAIGVIGPFGPKLVTRFGMRHTLLASMWLQLAGLVVMASVAKFDSYAVLLVGGLLVGFGCGFGIAPGTAAVLNALPLEEAGDGSDATQLARQVGAAVSVASLGTILAVRYRDVLAPALAGLTPDQTSTANSGIHGALSVAGGVAGSAGAALAGAARDAFAQGAQWAFIAAAVVTAITLGVIRSTVPAEGEHEADDDAEMDASS